MGYRTEVWAGGNAGWRWGEGYTEVPVIGRVCIYRPHLQGENDFYTKCSSNR